MEAFRWTPCFVTGLTDVDVQHRGLVDLINHFGALILRKEGAKPADVGEVLDRLAQYANHHFIEEEKLMEAARLDAKHIEGHREKHANFLEEVAQLRSAVQANNEGAARSLLDFLTHWLAYHILGSDHFMARQIAMIRAGASPQDAYAAQATPADPATETLLTALNGLFQQVSERNQALVQLNRTLEARVAERTQALTEANQRLEDLANTDPLTSLPNRRHAMLSLAAAWDAAAREQKELACMMVDADGFKAINDAHGHDAGDAVLRALSTRLRHAVRTDDLVCRLGGDEFLIICAATGLEGGLILGEKIRSEVASLRVPVGAGHWAGSVSVGVAVRTSAMQGLEDLMKAADQGVYRAKASGRNCVASVHLEGAAASHEPPDASSPAARVGLPLRRTARS